MAAIFIQLKTEEGFSTELHGNTVDLSLLKEKAIQFIERSLGLSEALKVKIRFNDYSNYEDNRIRVIKSIRTAFGLGLQEAKNLCDTLAGDAEKSRIMSNLCSKENIENIKEILNPFFIVEIV